MENASKALIIAAEILIGVLLLTLMVFMFHAMGTFSKTVDDNIETKNVSEFNINFEKYRGKSDITVQDIVSMGNLAKQYNEKMGNEQLQIMVTGVSAKYRYVHKLNDEQTYDFIKDYSTVTRNEGGQRIDEVLHFECTEITYDNETGKINRIVLKNLE